MERHGGRACVAVFVAPLIAGCGGGNGGTPSIAGVGRDSAGVMIVESREPEWPAGTGWRLAAAPQVEIEIEGGVAGIVGLPDGRLVVADGGASEIRMYDASPRLIRAAGRAGDGPGEYRRINAVGVGPGDTLWVYDFGTRRFTLLGSGLRVARTVTLGGDLANVGGVAMLPDGGFVVREFWSSRPTGGLAPGLRRDPAAVARVGVNGGVRDTIALVLGREVLVSSEGGRAVMSAPLAARAASVAWGGDGVIVSDQATFELRTYGMDGALRRVTRRPGLDLRLGSSDRDLLLAARLAPLPQARRPARRIELEALPLPPTRPAHGEILVDVAGRVWVAAWVAGDGAPPAWSVFETDGRWLGDVPMPPGFTPGWIGEDRLVGVRHDSLGVERVAVYWVERE